MARNRISFVAFFLKWAEYKRWKVPLFHVQVCAWLESFERIGVLMALRGGAKSNILGCYIAWRLWEDRNYHALVQGADDKLARKVARHAKDVIRRHPWLRDENMINPADWATEQMPQMRGTMASASSGARPIRICSKPRKSGELT